MDQASRILANSDVTLLSGDDSLTLPLMSIGGRGVISVVGNILPNALIEMVAAFDAGDTKKATELHYKLFFLCRDMLGMATNPIPIKCAMKLLGRDTGELRLPMISLSAEQEASLKKTLEEFGAL